MLEQMLSDLKMEMLVKKEDILQRWTQYVKDLFHDYRNTMPEKEDSVEGHKILKSEARMQLQK